MDNDIDLDVVVASYGDNSIYWFENNGTEVFTQHVVTNSAATSWGVFAADIDHDRDIDVISGTYIRGDVSLYENLSSVVGLSIDSSVPNQFMLYQNYPNPFNPTTIIPYELSSQQHVTIKVYNVLGREVATLVNEQKSAGAYTVEFSAKGGSASDGNTYDLSSGIYFYTMHAGTFRSTKKMILLR
jgi:hypothetical protein